MDVQWERNGNSNSYRMGAEGKFDLTVLDVSSAACCHHTISPPPPISLALFSL